MVARSKSDNGAADQYQPILCAEKRAAQILGLSPRTMFNLRQKGHIPYVRTGKKILYRLSSLEAYAEQNERRDTPEAAPVKRIVDSN